MQPRRERLRQMAFDEIKALSWEIIAKQGIDDLTVNGIAKRMGMTPPAFYRYYKSRDALIRSLVLDAYYSFRRALEIARDSVPEEETASRLYTVFMAYREWAVNNSNMFGLFAGRKVYGFDRQDTQVISESEKVYKIFTDLYEIAWKRGVLRKPAMKLKMPGPYLEHFQNSLTHNFKDVPLEIINLILNSACLVHGMISMELSGRLDAMVGEPGLFYQFQILDMLNRFGMEYQP